LLQSWQFPTTTWHGLDTVQALTEAQAQSLSDSPTIVWGARYIPKDDRRLEEPDDSGGDYLGCWTLSRSESRLWGQAGIFLAPIQWGPSKGDRLCAELGHQWGVAAAKYARWLGVPDGVHLWFDVEGALTIKAGDRATIAHVEAQAAAAISYGYRAGGYFSLPLPLTGAQMYGLKGITSYWLAAQRALEVPLPRGEAIRQEHLRAPRHSSPAKAKRCHHARSRCPIVFGQRVQLHTKPICPITGDECFVPIGLSYDPDQLYGDRRGESPVLWAPS
jgi:hypothetical protein